LSKKLYKSKGKEKKGFKIWSRILFWKQLKKREIKVFFDFVALKAEI